MKKPQHLGHCLLQMNQRSQFPAIQYKLREQWIKKSWQEYYQDIELIGAALLELGIQPGDRVAIMSNSRYEWSVLDYAILGIRAVTVPIYQNNSAEDVEFILNNCEAKLIACELRGSFKVFESVWEKCPGIRNVIVVEEKSPQKI